MQYQKSDEKRTLILQNSQKVFQEIGYKNVTMKDIVDACGISRGGVYIYFKSVREIFENVLEKIQEEENENKFHSGDSASQYFDRFLSEQKQQLLDPKKSLIIANYEYLFSIKDELTEDKMMHCFKSCVIELDEILKIGIKDGTFHLTEKESFALAEHIVFLIEGMRISCTVFPLSESQIDSQINHIKGFLK